MKRCPQYCLIYLLIFSISWTLGCQPKEADKWHSLFNGKDLEGWEYKGGDAKIEARNGEIVGYTKMNTHNSFLTTKEKYGDFALEFEVFLDPEINSGVQIRSHSRDNNGKNIVFGYQVEIDPSPRGFSGGIYDESRRAWLYPLSRNEKGRTAFKNGTWNQVHIEAIGSNIRTWINGIHCADLIDDMTSSGFIGLQVHGIGSREMVGKEIKWRNLKIRTTEMEEVMMEIGPNVPQLSYLINQLTEKEKDQGWKLLWDGESLDGWKAVNEASAKRWLIQYGVLSIGSLRKDDEPGFGDIVTEQSFGDFELELEFKVEKGANSGIKYFIQPPDDKGIFPTIGCEFQILDDRNHADSKLGVDGNRTVGSVYDLVSPKNLSVPGRGKQFKGIGAWNHARIVSKNGKVEHWLNHEKTLEYDRFSPAFAEKVAQSKFGDVENFGKFETGHILLQDHGGGVEFRNIKLREFSNID